MFRFYIFMKDHIPPYLLDKYLKGDCTPQEEVRVNEWYNSFEREKDYISALSDLKKAEIRNRIRNRIANDLGDTDFESYVAKDHKAKKMRYAGLMSAAALIIILFAIIKFDRPHSSSNATLSQQRVTTINNTRRIQQLVLSDGSHVWLSPGAQISYGKSFQGTNREVHMTGEVFFEVKKNPQKPFIIYSKDIITKVWGTSFRVRDFDDQSFADVAVVTGKVSVRVADPKAFSIKNKAVKDRTTELMLYPNQEATFVKKEKLLEVRYKKDIKELNIWKRANLYFDNSPIAAVIPVLNREFGVSLIVADHSIDEYELSADFNGLNFAQIMEILKKTLNISYDMNEKTIMLKTNE